MTSGPQKALALIAAGDWDGAHALVRRAIEDALDHA
jgi:hypothetical protein